MEGLSDGCGKPSVFARVRQRYFSCPTARAKEVTTAMTQFGEYKSILDTVFFLVSIGERRSRGEKLGGTGFLVAFPSTRFPGSIFHMYAVTNWHVALQGHCRHAGEIAPGRVSSTNLTDNPPSHGRS